MSETTTEQVKKKSFKFNKKYLSSTLCLGIFAVGGLQGYNLFFGEEPAVALTSTISYGQLGTTITGSGSTTSAETSSIFPASNSEVLGVYVTAGETILEGQLLYMQDDSELDDRITVIEEQISTYNETISDYYEVISGYNDNIADYNEDIADLNEDIADTVVLAPFSGKITEISVDVADNVSNNSKLAQLTSSIDLDVVLYFSYAYEEDIYVGQSASVSIPEQMLTLSGKVSKISKVEYITAEGTRCFAVTISVENPGSLKAGTSVSATIGTMYPVESGTLDNALDTSVNAPMAGTISHVLVDNYQNVVAGEKLFMLDTETLEEQKENLYDMITSVREKISDQNEKIYEVQEKIADLKEDIEEINEERDDFLVYSDISGKVITVNVREGYNANANQAAVIIYNMDTMQLTANVDELDIEHVSMGMEVDLSYSTGGSNQNYKGYVSSMSYEASNENGVAYFPIVISVDSEGALSSGVNVSYSISVGDTGEGYLVPVDALKQSDEGTCVYIQGSSASALKLEDGVVPDGYYAQLVEIDTSDSSYALVKEGLEDGMVVFTRYQIAAPSGGDSTSSAVGGTAEMDMDAMMAMRDSMMASGERPNSSGTTTGGGMSGGGRGG